MDQCANGINVGCTEIPLPLKQAEIPVLFLDSLTILACAAIRRAGSEPVKIPSEPPG